MLRHFRQQRNRSMVTHVFHFSRTATSSATNEYVTVPEHIGQNKEPASRNEERIKSKPSLTLKIFGILHSEINCRF